MCTVTFIPVAAGAYLTSNRDEQLSRKKALHPKVYSTEEGQSLMYPRDEEKGGSWIALKRNQTAAVLLNGGFENHAPLPNYKVSRGIIFLQIISESNPLEGFRTIDLSEVAPFTLILYTGTHLYEARWTGAQKTDKQLDPSQPHIWSSATLYSSTVQAQRLQWFQQFLRLHSSPTPEQVLAFHTQGGNGDPANNLRMNREKKLLTVSIAHISLRQHNLAFTYLDLLTETQTTLQFVPAAAPAYMEEVYE